MNNETVISVEDLGKKYSIRHERDGSGGYQTFREVLTGKTAGLFKKLKSGKTEKLKPGNGSSDFSVSESQRFSVSRASTEEFWALKNINFEVKRGEVLGIVGRNGAGKTTLLKILSRITEPTEGRVRIKGRVASLLEVGTGFHPELTGRENIYLNGAILGMSKAEIKKKFDEIVAFAETEKFLDTPVKRYSSGMYVRLAFAVAAHLEPEILVVDEVLAVGDAEFQKKCLGKMQDVSTKEGRTVLFVSHNLAAVRQLCTHALLLEKGNILVKGESSEVADCYLREIVASKRDRFKHGGTGYTNVRLLSPDGSEVSAILPQQEVFVELSLCVTNGSNVQCGFTIYNQMDSPLILCASEHADVALVTGVNVFRVRVPSELLQPGMYRIEGAVWDQKQVFHQEEFLCHFQVMPTRSRELMGRRSLAQFVSREPWAIIRNK
jgi:ABC-type polysaccharide/polyol phosphate transport system ATPase subunit